MAFLLKNVDAEHYGSSHYRFKVGVQLTLLMQLQNHQTTTLSRIVALTGSRRILTAGATAGDEGQQIEY
jgi:hypothetical protein